MMSNLFLSDSLNVMDPPMAMLVLPDKKSQ